MNLISEILNRHPVAHDGLSEVEWSQRARNALALAGITDLGALVYADGKTLQGGKNVGVATMREFIRGCLSQHVKPQWLRDVTLVHNPHYLVPSGYVVLSGPYASHERWMLELAIAQLGDVDWCVVQDDAGLMLCRAVEGFVEVPEEI